MTLTRAEAILAALVVAPTAIVLAVALVRGYVVTVRFDGPHKRREGGTDDDTDAG